MGIKLSKSILRVGRPVDAWAVTAVARKTADKAATIEIGMCILVPLFTWKFRIFD